MSRTTNFSQFIIFGHHFESENDIDHLIEDTNQNIQAIKTEIGMIASSTPRDIVPHDTGWEPLEYIRNRLTELYDSLEEELSTLAICYMTKNNVQFLEKI